MRSLTGFVPGRPVPQDSMRSFRHASTSRIVTLHSSAKLPAWRAAVAAGMTAADPSWVTLAGPVRVDLVFTFGRPKSHYRTGKFASELKPSAPVRMSGGPDIDKLTRAINDALTTAGTFDDDKRVTELVAAKRWCEPGELEGCRIVVDELPENTTACRPEGDGSPWRTEVLNAILAA